MDINTYLFDFYVSIENIIPLKYKPFISLVFYLIFITLYALFIWEFYRFIGKRDIIKLDLNKYNNATHPTVSKILEILLFFIESLIIFPIVIFFWFIVLSLFLLFLSKSQSINQIILIAAGTVGAIRITSYISEDLSKDLAKVLPFTLLAIFLMDPRFFSINDFIIKLLELPLFIKNIFLYLFFVFIIETIMRLILIIVITIKEPKNDE